MTKRVYRDGFWLTEDEAAEQDARVAREIADPSFRYAGRGKNRNLVHLIAGEAKKSREPHAVCGLWVRNLKRAPNDGEKVCSKCTRGGTSFSTYNQPRTCADCGRRFADAAMRDSNDTLCPDCYDAAGKANEHADGEHRDEADPDCPDCADRIRTESLDAAHRDDEHDGAVQSSRPVDVELSERAQPALADHEEEQMSEQESAPALVLTDVERMTVLHGRGQHTVVIQGCPSCDASVRTATARERADDEIERAERRINRHISEMAKRLRRMADDLEVAGLSLVARHHDTAYTLVDRASVAVHDVNNGIYNLQVHRLIDDAAELQQAIIARGGLTPAPGWKDDERRRRCRR